MWAKRHGQSKHTPEKLDAVGRVLRQLIRISRVSGFLASRPFWVVDLNSGPGVNVESGLPGTPAQAILAAAELRRHIRCVFVDNDGEHIAKLNRLLSGEVVDGLEIEAALEFADCQTVHADNGDFCRRLTPVALGRGPIHGVVVVDPNGAALPIAALDSLFATYPRLDLLACYSANALNRARGRFGGKWDFRFRDVVARFGQWKSHSYIMPPAPADPWRRTIVYAANFEPKSPPRGFVPTTSVQGTAIVEELSECKQPGPTGRIENTYGIRASAQLELWSSTGPVGLASGARGAA